MKKLLLITLSAVLISFSVSGQKPAVLKVPAVVKASFAKQFPKATDVKWEKEDAVYEVTLKNNGQVMTVTLNNKGILTETEVGIKPSDLPAQILKYVREKFKGKTILSADKITAGSKLTYEVNVQKGQALIFDPNGKLLEKAKD